MKIGIYTNVLLSIIAFSVVMILFKDLGIIPLEKPTRPLEVSVVELCGHKLNALDLGIPVEVQNPLLEVEVNK